MRKIFLDTNFWVRFLIQDDSQKYQDCRHLVEAIESGQFSAYTSTIVLLETNFVLTKNYHVPAKLAIEKISGLLHLKSLSIIEKTSFPKALKLHQQTRVKLADCLIATQLPPKATLVTYDEDFKKIPHLSPQTPANLLAQLPQN